MAAGTQQENSTLPSARAIPEGDRYWMSGRGGIARRRGCHLRAQTRAPPATAVISKDPRAPSPAPVYTTKSSRRTSEPIPSAAATALVPDTPWRTALRTKIAGATNAPTTYAGAIGIHHGPSMSVTKPTPKRSSIGRAISAKAHTKTGRSAPMSEGGPFFWRSRARTIHASFATMSTTIPSPRTPGAASAGPSTQGDSHSRLKSGIANQRSRNPTIVTDQTPKTKSLGSRLGDLDRTTSLRTIVSGTGILFYRLYGLPPVAACGGQKLRSPL